MKSRAGPIMCCSLVELAPEIVDVGSAPRIRPSEDFRCRLSISINPHEAVPERARCDVSDLTVDRVLQYVVDRLDDLFERDIGVDLRPAVIRCRECAFIFYKRVRQHSPANIVESRADTGRADIQSEYEFLGQDSLS